MVFNSNYAQYRISSCLLLLRRTRGGHQRLPELEEVLHPLVNTFPLIPKQVGVTEALLVDLGQRQCPGIQTGSSSGADSRISGIASVGGQVLLLAGIDGGAESKIPTGVGLVWGKKQTKKQGLIMKLINFITLQNKSKIFSRATRIKSMAHQCPDTN